ncbi:MAG: AmmeMemoRadiSam system protein B [Candidatus Aenigmarchaeota archaeon]|nr:AmmeMemoRadiSam system protein B [Candidatus Aenigmarchaeota archaeon]
MNLRNAVFSGSFYNDNPIKLKKTIDSFISNCEKRQTLGLVVPHAGYIFSGKTACIAYSAVKKDFDTIILFGTNHNSLGSIDVSNEAWETPLGILEPDIELIEEITKDFSIKQSNAPHQIEHSIEVQLPFIKHVFGDVKIVPISMNPYYFDSESCEYVGSKVAFAVKKLGRKALLVASSDFTHYGASYGFEPYRGSKNVLEKIKENDMALVDLITKLRPESVIDFVEKNKMTVCGYGPIAAMLFAAKQLGAKSGKLLDYSTSFDVSKNKEAIVGYAGIAIY